MGARCPTKNKSVEWDNARQATLLRAPALARQKNVALSHPRRLVCVLAVSLDKWDNARSALSLTQTRRKTAKRENAH